MGKFKRNYLRREEKDELMSLACLISVTRKMVDRYQEFRKNDKGVIKNLKTGLTFSKKAMEEIFDSLDADILEDVKNFVETKEVLIADPKDARLCRNRASETDNVINVDTRDFVAMAHQIKSDICQHCDGTYTGVEKECPYKKVLLFHSPVDGLSEYDKCPFIGDEFISGNENVK